jgi:4-carboxymuconolactone decarboxylase
MKSQPLGKLLLNAILILICSTITGVALAQTQSKPPRFPQLTMEQLTPQQELVARDILKISSAGIGGPYNALLRSPEMASRAMLLFQYLRLDTSVPKRLNEFAILLQARLATAQYEWWAHYPIAMKAGLSEAIAADLQQGKRPSNMADDEEAVYQFCLEMSLNHKVSDATFYRLKNKLGEQQTVDLIVLSGTYVMVSMLLNTAEAGVPNNGPLPLKPMTDAELRKGLLAGKKVKK